ncbi:MAG: hypothetical protein IK065_04175 [Neisseriaceae bacterium]|nr:hypothetical protein [Neisseriaceae bacterium]
MASTCAIVVEGKNGGLYPENDNSWRAIPTHIYKIMMGGDEYHDEIPNVLLSELWFWEENIFADDELPKLQEEINELIEKQLVTQDDMQEILKLLQFAIDNHRRVMFTPFWIDDFPSEEI